MNKVIPITAEKVCGGCTACCSGVLDGTVYDHSFWRGKPCHFVEKNGCSIYENRPEFPCKSYVCGYIEFDWMPTWMRPDKSNVILTKRIKNNIEFIEVLETEGQMRAEILNFIYLSYLEGKFKNMVLQVNGGYNYIGSLEFLKLRSQKA